MPPRAARLHAPSARDRTNPNQLRHDDHRPRGCLVRPNVVSARTPPAGIRARDRELPRDAVRDNCRWRALVLLDHLGLGQGTVLSLSIPNCACGGTH